MELSCQSDSNECYNIFVVHCVHMFSRRNNEKIFSLITLWLLCRIHNRVNFWQLWGFGLIDVRSLPCDKFCKTVILFLCCTCTNVKCQSLLKIRKIFQNVCWNFYPAWKALTLKMPRKSASEMSSVYVIYWIFLQTFQTYFCIKANSVDPDQTAPRGAVWSGSTLFAKMIFKITSRWQSTWQLLWLAV